MKLNYRYVHVGKIIVYVEFSTIWFQASTEGAWNISPLGSGGLLYIQTSKVTDVWLCILLGFKAMIQVVNELAGNNVLQVDWSTNIEALYKYM